MIVLAVEDANAPHCLFKDRENAMYYSLTNRVQIIWTPDQLINNRTAMNKRVRLAIKVEYFNDLFTRSMIYNKQGHYASRGVPIHADPVRVKSRTIEILQWQLNWWFISLVEIEC